MSTSLLKMPEQGAFRETLASTPSTTLPRTNTTAFYRADIDGLRAVAVIPVVLFHAGARWFSGGYVGVDVFFVISGYLITTILVQDFSAGRYSIARFYERRIRRIFPALFVVVLCSSVVGHLLLLPEDLKAFAKSVVATTLFVSNIVFWGESGYFDGPAEMKPLLHTWSLAVEEQYYIAFPIVLFLLYRFASPRIASWVIALGALLSFGLSVWGVHNAPVATFYLLPTRGWELLVGSLLAVGLVPLFRSRAVAEIAAAFGIALILFAVFTFDHDTPFPGLNALAPCIGAALLIQSGRNGFIPAIGRALSSTPLRFVGLISYSLYLWHWPIIVFTKYVWIENLPAMAQASVVVASIIAAALSWRFVEGPFRDRSRVSTRRIFVSAAAAMAVAIAVAIPGIAGNGLPDRLPASVVKVMTSDASSDPERARCHLAFSKHMTLEQLCVRGEPGRAPSFLLVGDSHAGAVAGGIFEGARRAGVSGIQLTESGYRPVPTLISLNEPDKYARMNVLLEEVLRNPAIRTVIVVAYWEQAVTEYRYATPDGKEVAKESGIQLGLSSLARTYSDRRFLLMTAPPAATIFGASPAARALLFGKAISTSIPRGTFDQTRARYDAVLRALDREPNVDVVDITDLLCDADRCVGYLDDQLAYRDDNHLTHAAALRLAPLFAHALSPLP